MENTRKYSGLTRWTHWLTAVFVIVSLVSGNSMEHQISVSALRTHSISGALLMILLILRLFALRHKRPEPLHESLRLQRLYQALLLQRLS